MKKETPLKTRWNLCGYDSAAFKGKAEIICVDGLGVPLFIGHVTPWGRTNWWPQRAPCFVPAAHKDIGLQSRRELGGGGSRFPIE